MCFLPTCLQSFHYDIVNRLVFLASDLLKFPLIWPCWSSAPAPDVFTTFPQPSLSRAGDTNQMDPMCPRGIFQGRSAMLSKTNTLRSATTTVGASRLVSQSGTKNHRNTEESHCLSSRFIRLRSTSFSGEYIPRPSLLARYHSGSRGKWYRSHHCLCTCFGLNREESQEAE